MHYSLPPSERRNFKVRLQGERKKELKGIKRGGKREEGGGNPNKLLKEHSIVIVMTFTMTRFSDLEVGGDDFYFSDDNN